MEEIRAIISDDEQKARNGLRGQMERLAPEIKVVTECGSVEEAYEKIVEYRPNVVFLDVEMLDGTGFDLLRKFEKIDFHVIFTTAYDQYAQQAFRFNAIDYLLKPIDPDELLTAIKKLKVSLSLKTDQQKQLQILLNNLSQQQVQEQKIAIHESKKISYLTLKDIVHLTAEGAYTSIKLVDGRSVVSAKTLKYYFDLLQDKRFCRTHRSNVVNLELVSEFSNRDGGQVIMGNGDAIWVSKDRKKELLQSLSFNDKGD